MLEFDELGKWVGDVDGWRRPWWWGAVSDNFAADPGDDRQGGEP